MFFGSLVQPQSFSQIFNDQTGMFGNLMDMQMKQKYAQQYPQLLKNQVGMSNNALANSNATTQYAPSNAQIANQTNSAALQKALITNQYLPQTLGVDNQYKMAMARYMSSPAMIEKYMTPTGKTYVEPNVVNSILSSQPGVVNATPNQPSLPTGGMAGTPSPNIEQQVSAGPQASGMVGQQPGAQNMTVDPQEVKQAYAAVRQKQTSDASTRQKSNYAVNIQKTFDEMDPSTINYYSGLKGQAQLKADKLNAIAGTTTPEYEKYNNFAKVQVPILADQIRQFYGTSIQPAMHQSLQELTNPITWDTNPKLALSQFNSLKELLGKEMDTYQSTLNAPIQPFKSSQAQSSVADSKTTAVKIPSFNSKKDFQEWFKSQPADVKTQVTANLR